MELVSDENVDLDHKEFYAEIYCVWNTEESSLPYRQHFQPLDYS